MRTPYLSQSSCLYSLPMLAIRCADILVATERASRHLYVRRMGDYAVQYGRHDFVVLMEHRFTLSHKEVQS